MRAFTVRRSLRQALGYSGRFFAVPAVLAWLAKRRVKTVEPAVSGRFHSLAAGLAFAVSLLLIPARLSTASPIFATYSGADAGSLDGVGFSMSGLSNPSFGSPIQALGDMSGPDWNSVGSQQGRTYNANSVTTFNVTFAEPVSNLQMYLYYFRGGGGGGGGYDSYDFGEGFTITGGLGTPVTQSGTTLNTATANFANGVISFITPVSSLAVTTTGGPATGSDQAFTFAVVPEPGAAGLVSTAVAVTCAGFLARRRKDNKDTAITKLTGDS